MPFTCNYASVFFLSINDELTLEMLKTIAYIVTALGQSFSLTFAQVT